VSKTLIFFLFCFAFAGSASAQNIYKRRVKKKVEEPSNIEQRVNFDWLNGGFLRNRSESTYNPNNTIFETENYGLRTDLNVDYRLTYNTVNKFVVRPRAYSQYTNYEISADEVVNLKRNRGKIDLTEAFAEMWPSDQVSVTLGLQNFQWGPAEIISPSNPLYHFNREQRSILWKEKGRNLVRVNWSPSQTWSFVGMAEVASNGEPDFIADRDFQPKGVLKAEVRSESESQNYLGLTTGTEEERKPFIGVYGAYVLVEGFSLYTDLRWTQQGFVYAPVQNGFFYNMEEDERFPQGTWHHLGVFGARYEHEKFDLRVEFIRNPRGYSKEEFEQAFQSAIYLNPRSEVNAGRIARPGLELFGENYGYISLRVPDIGREKQLHLAFRYLHSMTDSTGLLSSTLEWNLTDHFVAVAEARQSVGPRDREFTLQESSYGFLGLKALW
jgi:hypothetical protein